jgi:predicted nucleic acid-binding protein
VTALVVDASVAVKWYLPEEHSHRATRLLSLELALHAPDLLYPEVGNVLWKRVRRGLLQRDQAISALALLVSVPIRCEPAGSLAMVSLQIALETGRSVYDSLYLGLARDLGCPLVTADRRFFDALQNGPYAPDLLWIEDIP